MIAKRDFPDLNELGLHLQEIASYINEISFWWHSCNPNDKERKCLDLIEDMMTEISDICPWENYRDIIDKVNEINLKAECLRQSTKNKELNSMLKTFVQNIKVVGHGSISNRKQKYKYKNQSV